MENRTKEYYNTHSSEISEIYESVDFRPVLTRILDYAPNGGKLLEVGCGSGRDAAFYLEQGYEVTALDGSVAMLREAAKYHPELGDRLLHHELPESLPFEGESFDVATSMAMLMHLPKAALPGALFEIARVVRSGGIVAYSVNTARAGLDERGNDEKGRRFTCLTTERWERLHLSAGLETIYSWENDDLAGRPGIRWATFLCKRG